MREITWEPSALRKDKISKFTKLVLRFNKWLFKLARWLIKGG